MVELFKSIANNGAKFGRVLVVAGLALAVFSIFWFLVAALGTKFGIWDFGFGLMTMTFSWGVRLVLGTFGLCALGILLSLFASPRTRPAILGLVGILISSLILGRLSGVRQEAERLPPIHDIQTDWSEPIAFSEELMKIRGDSNPVVDAPVISELAEGSWPGYGGRLVSEVQEEAEWEPPLYCLHCSDSDSPSDIDNVEMKEKYARENSKQLKYAPYPYILDSKYYRKSLDDVFESVEFVVKSRGWEIVTNDEEAGIIEATDSTSWFGFEDDVAIRVRLAPESIHPPHSRGSESVEEPLAEGEFVPVKVDIRSVSRVGLTDIGTNAKRVSKFRIDLDRAVHRKR